MWQPNMSASYDSDEEIISWSWHGEPGYDDIRYENCRHVSFTYQNPSKTTTDIRLFYTYVKGELHTCKQHKPDEEFVAEVRDEFREYLADDALRAASQLLVVN